MTQRFYHSVRFKLLLVSLTLLGIPWAGYRFILETEQFLRDAQNQNLQSTANALARVVEQHPEAFSGSRLPGQPPSQRNLYLHRWDRAPVVDGYADEWANYAGQFSSYRLPDGTMDARLALGKHQHFAYLLLSWSDRKRNYGRDGDRVDISIGRGQQLTRLFIRPDAPGWVIAQRQQGRASVPEPRIRGEWQETPQGYTLELRLPEALLGEHLAIAINDGASGSRLQTSRLYPLESLGRLVQPSPDLQALLDDMTPPATRAWVVDHDGLVLARAGQLDDSGPLSADQDELPWLVQKLILAVLPRRADQQFDLSENQSRLDMPPLSEALAGRPASLRRRIPDSDAIVVSAAVPVRRGQSLVGGILIEQTTNAILSIQNLALQRLFAVTLIFFVVTSLGLLLFASLLTSRIRRLRNQLEHAVSHDGRIIGTVKPGRSRDEIGELGRGFAAVLARLGDYNHYLEAMASRLAHELRTPLSVVKTSLDNAGLSEDENERRQYIERAHGGAERLELILKRLREATRLEQSLQQAQVEPVALAELLRYQRDSFAEIWPEVQFELDIDAAPEPLTAVPDLICQALEKLVSNAVDFHQPETPIRLQLQHEGDWLRLAVSNTGAHLPEGIDLFKSMVSARTARSDEPHLGLGLYLVRLIAEFHRGRAFAENHPDGACIGILLPLKTSS